MTSSPEPQTTEKASPDAMREAMAEYVRTVHQAYRSQSAGQPPAVRGRMALLNGPFTVVAAGVRNLHVIATRDPLPPPSGQEVAIDDELDDIRWTLRFYDPVVLPQLGMIDESTGPAADRVRRTIGISTYIYHLIVQPGSQLTSHHAGHAGAGLAMDHVSDARDFETIRSRARGSEALVDEMEGAAQAGLIRAQGLLATQIAREVAPWDDTVAELAGARSLDPVELRRVLLAAVRGKSG